MPHGHQKLYFLGFIIIILFAALLIWQIKKNVQMETEHAERPLVEKISVDIPLSPEEPIFGNQGAAITIIEFIDLNKADDLELHQKIKKFITDHPTDMRLIMKDFPAQSFFNKDKNKIHRVARCIAAQNKNNFWLFIDDVSQYKKPNDEEILKAANPYVAQPEIWQTCVTNNETENQILSDISFIKSLGLRVSPVIFINNRLVNYVTEIDIDDLLNQLITPLP